MNQRVIGPLRLLQPESRADLAQLALLGAASTLDTGMVGFHDREGVPYAVDPGFEAQHPRAPEGTARGGTFIEKPDVAAFERDVLGVDPASRLAVPVQPGVRAAGGAGFGRCTQLALALHRRTGADVWVGIAVRADRYAEALAAHARDDTWLATEAFPHAWNVVDGRLVDRSLGSDGAAEHVYFGERVPREALASIADGDALARWHAARMQHFAVDPDFERQHPRAPEGTPQGGTFIEKPDAIEQPARGERGWIIDRQTGAVLRESSVGKAVAEEWQSNVDLGRLDDFADRDILVVHTHPEQMSFSDGDWLNLVMHAGAMQVVLPDGSVRTLEKPADYDWKKATPRRIRELWAAYENEIFDSNRSLAMTVEQIAEEINERLAAATGITYSRMTPLHPAVRLFAVDPDFERKHPRGIRGTKTGGRFVEKPGGGAAQPSQEGAVAIGGPKAKAKALPPVGKIVRTTARAWQAEPVPIAAQLTKPQTGDLGEAIAVAFLKQLGFRDAGTLNYNRNNFALDLVHDHELFEVKTGLVSNSRKAQQWRVTLGEPGVKEKAWLKTASAAEKAAHNLKKAKAALTRKTQAMREVQRALGRPVKVGTLCLIVNPDTRTADLYRFRGFHGAIQWGSDFAKKGYVGSVQYNPTAKAMADAADAKPADDEAAVPADDEAAVVDDEAAVPADDEAAAPPDYDAVWAEVEAGIEAEGASFLRTLLARFMAAGDNAGPGAAGPAPPIPAPKAMATDPDFERKHPRAPKGTAAGGKFIPKSGVPDDELQPVPGGKQGIWHVIDGKREFLLVREGEPIAKAIARRRHAIRVLQWQRDHPTAARITRERHAERKAAGLARTRARGGTAVAPPVADELFPEREQTLSTSAVSMMKRLGGGVTDSQIVTFANGDRAVFKPPLNTVIRGNIPVGGDIFREAAAWELAKLTKMTDLVPPTILRTINGKRGSLQAFVKGAKVAHDVADARKFDGEKDLRRSAIFDLMVGNTDRHAGNWMITESSGKLALIDNGLAFPNQKRVHNLRSGLVNAARRLSITDADRQVWKAARPKLAARLRAVGLDDDAIHGIDGRIEYLLRPDIMTVGDLTRKVSGGGGYF